MRRKFLEVWEPAQDSFLSACVQKQCDYEVIKREDYILKIIKSTYLVFHKYFPPDQ